MYVKLDGGTVAEVKLRIYEPPRFFEALLRGRAFTEAPDITARICGICPVAYQMSAVRAMEDACGVRIDAGPLRELRRLLYCGEWIESHSLHVYMLHAPDFLGYAGAVEMARDHARDRRTGTADEEGRKRGHGARGRPRDPPDQRPRGRLLPRADQRASCARLSTRSSGRARRRSRPSAGPPRCRSPTSSAPPSWSRCPSPAATRSTAGASCSDAGLDIAPGEFDAHIVEEHVEHSNALHARIRERGTYLTGPLARYALSSQALWPLARGAAHEAGLGPVCRNPFQSIVVRAVELVQACDEALAIIDRYEQPDAPAVEVDAAPRGRPRRHRGAPRSALPPL